MMIWLKERGLTLTLIAAVLVMLAGQIVTSHADDNEERVPVSEGMTRVAPALRH
jgi:hypothetical protein